jgi:hypothetical protein
MSVGCMIDRSCQQSRTLQAAAAALVLNRHAFVAREKTLFDVAGGKSRAVAVGRVADVDAVAAAVQPHVGDRQVALLVAEDPAVELVAVQAQHVVDPRAARLAQVDGQVVVAGPAQRRAQHHLVDAGARRRSLQPDRGVFK